MKRSKSLAAVVLAMAMVASAAVAEDGWIKRVAVLRDDEGPAGQMVEDLGKGEPVQVLKRDGIWVQITHKGKTGWVAADSISAREVRADMSLGNKATGAEMTSTTAGRGLEPQAEAFGRQHSYNVQAPNQMLAIKKTVTSQMLKDFMAEGNLLAPRRK